jgi:hypothetical protein
MTRRYNGMVLALILAAAGTCKLNATEALAFKVCRNECWRLRDNEIAAIPDNPPGGDILAQAYYINQAKVRSNNCIRACIDEARIGVTDRLHRRCPKVDYDG